jgi:hypothetical protein
VGAEAIARDAEEEAKAERIAECEQLAAPILDADDPLEMVRDSIKRQGYGGDTGPPTLVYLASTGRVIEISPGQMPPNTMVKGGSSTGKSFLVETVMRHQPPRAFLKLDASSEKALIHLNEDLRHRIIVLKEADSLPEDGPAAAFVRALIHDGRAVYSYPVRGEDGVWATHDKVHEGPTMLVTTSVRGLGHQLDTRVFTLDAPDDREYIRAALKAQALAELQ